MDAEIKQEQPRKNNAAVKQGSSQCTPSSLTGAEPPFQVEDGKFRLSINAWTAACQASLSFTISRNLLRLKSIELVMPSNHLFLCGLLLLLPWIFPSTRVFSNEKGLHIR